MSGVLLVTGGSRGIGKAVVETLAREGAKVAFVYHSKADAANAIVAEQTAAGREVVAFQCDVSKKEEADAVLSGVSVSATLGIVPALGQSGSRASQRCWRWGHCDVGGGW